MKANIPAPAEPKAYSYIRFSTPDQAKGDSLRRQMAKAQAWVDKHNAELDTELNLRDLGISAFRGANKETGALGTFLRAVEEGVVAPGSWLLVENLDRISRENAWDASFTMQGIIRAGITVVDLSDNGRPYNSETLRNNPTDIVVMVMMFARGNNESVTKSTRVADKFAEKRRRFATQEVLTQPYTRRLPGWLRWSEEHKVYELIEDRAELLRQMFKLADEGRGQHWIARWLNEQKVDVWGAGGRKAIRWHRTYVRKLLASKATIGTFVPHRVTRSDTGKRVMVPLDAIHNRFPAAVDSELFERVASRLRTTEARGRNSGAAPRSIFAGVLKCQHCGGTVTRVAKVAKGKHRHVYLVCSAANAKAGTCAYASVPYDQAEEALCLNVEHTIEQAPRGEDTSDTQRQIEDHQGALDGSETEIRGLLHLTITDKSRAARQRLKEAEQERGRIEGDLRALRDRRDALTSTNVAARLAAVKTALTETPLDVVKVNKALKTAVKRMVMRPEEGTLEIHWQHADEPQHVPFVTRRKLWDSPLGAAENDSIEKMEG